jgi:hypothetical protein
VQRTNNGLGNTGDIQKIKDTSHLMGDSAPSEKLEVNPRIIRS